MCAQSIFTGQYVYRKTRESACKSYTTYKVINGLCPHHKQYFEDASIISYPKNKDFEDQKGEFCVLSLSRGFIRKNSLIAAYETDGIKTFRKDCPGN